MSDSTNLERGYRRILACYPKAFRRENEDEIHATLRASAAGGQQRVGLARSPHAVLNAVRLMYIGAAAELAALVILVVTADGVRSAFFQVHPGFTPALWHVVLAGLVFRGITAPIRIGLWLWLAWANGRGRDAARLVFTAFFTANTLYLFAAVALHAEVYAPADLAASAVVWLLALATIVLIFTKKSWRYYRPDAARGLPAAG
jgi:hypothetical protein